MFESTITELSDINVYSLIFIDIDNFRHFNNEFGHQIGDQVLKIGDQVLKKVSQAIKDSVRTEDQVYRYGGEEIVVLLKHCEKKNAYDIAEKIRIRVNDLDNSSYPSIAVSLGVSNYPEDGENIVAIIEASDKALLAAKNIGKSRTVVYTK